MKTIHLSPFIEIVSSPPMTQEQVNQTRKLLDTPKDIVIIPHKNPDGDAMGSTLALYHYLKKKGHHPCVIAPNNYPKFLQWLPGNDSVVAYDAAAKVAKEKIEQAQLIFTLDFNDLSRTGDLQQHLEQATVPFIMIDHHQQPSAYATVTYSDATMSSTSEMVYHFMEALGDQAMVDATIGTCLYTGIMTDTGGSFRFPSTTATTHHVVSELIKAGVNNAGIHEQVYDNNRYSKLQLLGRALSNLKVVEKYKTSYITLSQKELDQHKFQKGDTEGFVNYGLSLEGVIFAVIFIENRSENIIKISFRSKGDFSVNEFARAHFNGGGHTNAAGGRSDLSLQKTTEHFLTLLSQYPELSL